MNETSHPAARHQIRLSADPDFQHRLLQTRIRLCKLGKTTGTVAEVARIAIHSVDPQAIIDILNKGHCPNSAPRATAPNSTFLSLKGANAVALRKLQGDVISLGALDLSLRSIVHGAIWALSELDEDTLTIRLATF